MQLSLMTHQNPDFPPPNDIRRDVPALSISVDTIAEAQAHCAEYIRKYDLGAGHFGRGSLYDSQGVGIGYIAYNGNVFMN